MALKVFEVWDPCINCIYMFRLPSFSSGPLIFKGWHLKGLFEKSRALLHILAVPFLRSGFLCFRKKNLFQYKTYLNVCAMYPHFFCRDPSLFKNPWTMLGYRDLIIKWNFSRRPIIRYLRFNSHARFSWMKQQRTTLK